MHLDIKYSPVSSFDVLIEQGNIIYITDNQGKKFPIDSLTGESLVISQQADLDTYNEWFQTTTANNVTLKCVVL